MFEHFRLEVAKEQKPIRIDQYIVSKIKYSTRNKVQNAIKNKTVLVNKKPVKVHYFLKPDDIITIYFSKPPNDKKIVVQNLNIDIIYEDASLIILNKPSGMLVHPTISEHKNTLLNGLLYHFEHSNTPNLLQSPGIVHRIDKNTSGLMVIAKNKISLKILSEYFYHHTIKRKYIALVYGELKTSSGTINANIDNNVNSSKAIISKDGKRSITHYKLLKKNKYFSLVECELETGRTHQIRIHFEHIGHPLFGDNTYNKGVINLDFNSSEIEQLKEAGQFLHSYYMKFNHPETNQEMEFEIKKPNIFDYIFDIFNNKS